MSRFGYFCIEAKYKEIQRDAQKEAAKFKEMLQTALSKNYFSLVH